MQSIEIAGYTIDDITKFLGAVAVGAYVLGYLVLSYSLSAFGFDPVSPFRPRVLETGVCALIFFLVPVLLGAAVASLPKRSLPQSLASVFRILLLPMLCSGICGFPGFTRDMPNSVRWPLLAQKSYLLVLAIVAGAMLIGLSGFTIRWLWRNFHLKKWSSLALLMLLSIVVTLLTLDSTSTSVQRRTFVWFTVLSIATCWLLGSVVEDAGQREVDAEVRRLQSALHGADELISETSSDDVTSQRLLDGIENTNSETKRLKAVIQNMIYSLESDTIFYRLKSFAWRVIPTQIFVCGLFAVALYTTWLFPLIPLKLGGGETLSVTLYRVESFHSPRIIHGSLLDQSEQGFFILPVGHNKGVFIPKETVEAIYFANDPLDLQRLLQ